MYCHYRNRLSCEYGHLNETMYNGNGDSVDPQDLIVQLARKDQDLILAAELGKELLDRNEELTLANERITEDYTRKLEVNTLKTNVCSSKHFVHFY